MTNKPDTAAIRAQLDQSYSVSDVRATILALCDALDDVARRTADATTFPADWRDMCGGMNMKQQGFWKSGFRTCRERVLRAALAQKEGE